MKPVRPSMSKARRARIFLAHDGVCELCGEKIDGDYEIEHRIAWAVSHDDSDGNLYPAHPACHALKTAGHDAAYIAKAKRMSGEKGQRARREKNGPSIVSRPFPKGIKRAWPKRSFGRK